MWQSFYASQLCVFVRFARIQDAVDWVVQSQVIVLCSAELCSPTFLFNIECIHRSLQAVSNLESALLSVPDQVMSADVILNFIK